MRWRKAAAAGGAALGAAALFNAATAQGVEPLENELGGEEGSITWRGHRIAYTVHGSGSPVLLVHGIYAGASSGEWRYTVPALAERHTVFALDLLGFGRSDRPALRYTPSLYQALLADVMTRLVTVPCAVVASSLTAAHVIALAARDSRHIDALGLIAPTGMAQLRPDSGVKSTVQLLLDAPIIGTSIYNGITSAAAIRRNLELVYADDRLVTEELVQTYVRSARQPGGKHAVGAFVGGRLDVDVRAALRRVRQPLLLLWGDQARQNPVQNAHAFRVIVPEAQWALVSEAGDLPHDERPEPTNTALLRFLQRARSGVRIPSATPLRGVPKLSGPSMGGHG
jgi:Predicted hydrolases or acyltransferases (alpha/beta hydrolase superfamily)